MVAHLIVLHDLGHLQSKQKPQSVCRLSCCPSSNTSLACYVVQRPLAIEKFMCDRGLHPCCRDDEVVHVVHALGL